MANTTKKTTNGEASTKSDAKKAPAKVDLWIFVLVTSILGGLLLLAIGAAAILLSLGVVSFSSNVANTASNIVSTVTSGTTLVDNPNSRVTAKGKLVTVKDLEFYLPYRFKEGKSAGGESNSTYTYNLENDEGWATVTVYVEKTDKDPYNYLHDKNRYLSKVDEHRINGQTWVEAESDDSIIAYATSYGDYVYAIIYTIKLDSDTTDDAEDMLSETLYFNKIYR